MKITERQLRKLIGKKVEWEYAHDRQRGVCLIRQGYVQDAKKQNICIEDDWLWGPELINLRIIDC